MMLSDTAVYGYVKHALNLTPTVLNNAELVVNHISDQRKAVKIKSLMNAVYRDYRQLKRLVIISKKKTDEHRLLLSKVSEQTLVYTNALTKLSVAYDKTFHEDIDED